ncbi:hypothetical protein ATANTOWER_017433 [Ataeniobius toweri]|uniref:Uncharacterized protein n=1 Tax=Ataeniobius toweri TaxID=208326 RepID=A0ABU7AYD4_9TELE|nr:hypothetical protein [Ataeniobius toweri]
MVNTSVTLPQSKDRSGSTRSDLEIVPRFTCLACPPGGTHWHSTLACQPQSPGLAHVSPEPTRSPTMSRSLNPAGYGILKLPKNTISVNLFKPFLSLVCCSRVSWFRTHHDTEWTLYAMEGEKLMLF